MYIQKISELFCACFLAYFGRGGKDERRWGKRWGSVGRGEGESVGEGEKGVGNLGGRCGEVGGR